MSTPGVAEHPQGGNATPRPLPGEQDGGVDGDSTAEIVHQLQQLVVDTNDQQGQAADTDHSLDFLSSAAHAFERAAVLTHVTAADLRRGYDMQGYQWKGIEDHKRHYMGYRRSVYPQFQSIVHSTYEVQKQALEPELVSDMYSFRYSALGDGYKSQINHFQLRDLVWATSSYDVFYWHSEGVHKWNPWMRTRECIVPRRRFPQGYRLSALCVGNGMVFTGDYRGRYCVAPLWSESETWRPVAMGKLDVDIINHIALGNSSGGAHSILVAHNNGNLHTVDVATMCLRQSRSFDWAVNSCAQTDDGRLQCAVGDNTSAVLLDARAPAESSPAAYLDGHYDYSFACAFSPDARLVATGSQDMAARVFDVRWPARPLAMFCGHIGAMRSVSFSPCGGFLAAAEPADYVHIYDTRGFARVQDIELMGEIAGATFSPDAGCLFVGVADALHGGGLLEFTANSRR
ncbi:hypothetical protein GGI15_000430 [Coemansia interrupta]|uniref:DUF2415 domain-containing protein n=1 Tax=Coemansia interrupta TaxID=1126814 RepID=A0A9W8LPJ9_9FUNG|nr:hypothetical protein GGI15_000430 [Coemansia interrupta]